MLDQETKPLSEVSQHALVQSVLLTGLDPAALASVATHVQEEVFPAGQVVFEEDDPGETVYFVVSGSVQVSKMLAHGQEYPLRVLGPGEFFGEMALLEDKPRSARVSTLTPATLLVVSRQAFNTLIERLPMVAISFLRAISARLRMRQQEQEVLLAEKQALVEELAAKNVTLEQTLAELRAAMATVAEHERMRRDLEIAHQIQQQMLPSVFPNVPGLRVHAITLPSAWVGGDFYDVVALEAPCDRPCMGLLLGDVSGKGIPAALHMARLMGEFRACLSHRADPEGVMQVLNDLLCQRNTQVSSFVTVQYIALDVRQRHMRFICAGHPPILVRHADGQIEPIGSHPNIPLGIDETFVYRQEERQLAAGDTLLLYSDGTYERRNAHGALFGLPRLSQLFATAPAEPEAIIHVLQEALTVFGETTGPSDDTTLLCAHLV